MPPGPAWLAVADALERRRRERRWPAFEAAILSEIIQREFPTEAAQYKGRIRPMSWVDRLLMPDAVAMQGRHIYYNKALGEQSGASPEDYMAHELTHVRQMNKAGGLLPFKIRYLLQNLKHSYRDNPYEKEAYAVQFAKRRRRMHDIRLPDESAKGDQ